MPSANLDLVRSIYAAWGRGDYLWSAEWAHPDVEFVLADGLTPGSSTGLAAMAERWREFLKDWNDFRAEAEEYRELDGERVLVFHRFGGRGRTSGLSVGETQAKGATVFHVCDGKVTRLVLYASRDLGLADLGLAPDARPPDL
jgi:ketosteroid isomerase-like protein